MLLQERPWAVESGLLASPDAKDGFASHPVQELRWAVEWSLAAALAVKDTVRRPFRIQERTSRVVHPEGFSRDDSPHAGDDYPEPRQWCVYDFAEVMEEGLAPGLTARFLERPHVEQRLRVTRASDRCNYRLANADGDTLLFARASRDGRNFDLLVAAAGDPPKALGPAFQLKADAMKNNWVLTSVRCECCDAIGRRTCGERELFHMRQYVEKIGEGKAYCMDLSLPGFREDGSDCLWCPMCGEESTDSWSDELSSKRPRWHPRHKSLAMSFGGRCKTASTKNFQLEVAGGGVRLFFGKLSGEGQSAREYILDYLEPLNAVQAFAASLAVMHWSSRALSD